MLDSFIFTPLNFCKTVEYIEQLFGVVLDSSWSIRFNFGKTVEYRTTVWIEQPVVLDSSILTPLNFKLKDGGI